jgi:DNA polymerase-3 subunit delta
MIYLFFGEDKYRLKARVNELLDAHRGNAGDINISVIEDKFDFPSIKNEAEALPFLSDKRLLVVKNALKSKDKALSENLTKWLPSAPESTDIIFIEDETPDQRTSLYKNIVKNGKVEIFTELKPAEVINWIKKMVQDKQAQISPEAATLLQIYCGSDLTRISTELDKLASYDPHITKTNVEKLVDAGFFNSIFELMDAISEKKAKKALDILNKSLDTGENEIYLLSMLARQVRNLLIIKDLSEHRLSESEIVGKTHLHPFVVKKSLQQSRNFTANELLALHGNLVGLDLAFKSTSTDPKLLLQKFVAEMCL